MVFGLFVARRGEKKLVFEKKNPDKCCCLEGKVFLGDELIFIFYFVIDFMCI